MGWYGWKPYVPVAKRRQQAGKKMETLRKKGVEIQPIRIAGRIIAKTFWGEAWCDHLESFSDYDNRLPRGRTYVRNGSVCHLAIDKGQVEAKVSGSDLYDIQVRIKTLPAKKWDIVKQRCSGQIGSLLELLRGDLSDNIMEVVTDPQAGLFPLPGEIDFDCDCPDWAHMCKHVAAVLYGVGARLDQDPALLFLLRGVDHHELIDENLQLAVPAATGGSSAKRLASDDLGDVFGIELATGQPQVASTVAAKAKGKTRKIQAKQMAEIKSKASAGRSVTNGTEPVAVRKQPTKKVVKQATARKPSKKEARGSAIPTEQIKSTARPKTALKKTTKKKSKKTSRKKVQPVS